MVYLPVRKCYYLAKVTALLIIVVTILALFEQWRGGKRSARAEYMDPLEMQYEAEIQEDEDRIVPGLGEGGVAAYLQGEDKKLGEESEAKLAINVYLSDRISYNRTLTDYRHPACQRITYDAELPSASVIIIFHNEPYSVVVRTLWSVLNSVRRDQPWHRHANFVDQQTGRTMKLGYPGQDPNSPLVYLKEIILVDDNSTLPELKGKLSHYIRTRLPPDLIRILRLPERQGLMSARTAGSRAARGSVLVFLDAHCEGQADWLRPLLHRVKVTRTAVLTPLIDVIDQSTFQLEAAENFQVGGFTFMGHFTWIDVPEREKLRRGSDIAPTWSPTMAGGLFAIDRRYYWELGAYDEQMAGWGGENLEMSFRVWQCGGTLETIPCSRVGHVFRSFHPYGMPAESDTHGINTARMAEVWMDEYAELFYMHRPDLRNNPKIGDVTHRKILREKLKCKSFQWYLDNIYREKFVPVRDAFGFGRFRNPGTGLCLDTLQREGTGSALGLYPCHPSLQPTQYLSLSLQGHLRDEEMCTELQYNRDKVTGENEGRRLLMATCRDGSLKQKWRYMSSQQIQHVESGLCLTATQSGSDALASTCRAHSPTQLWDIDYTEDKEYSHDTDPSEQSKRIQKLRGLRRISRSLMSAREEEEPATNIRTYNSTFARRTHKKRKHKRKHSKSKRKSKRTKNKFILKLVRTMANNTDDHLEVEISCKHKRLYPNNTFVRDLVTILNDKDIKVINNGRVFERNRVTELVKDPQTARQQTVKVLEKLDVIPEPQPAPVQNIQQMKRMRKKHHHMKEVGRQVARSPPPPPTPPSPPRPAAPPSPPQYSGPPLAPPPLIDHKKIIIEDFVEVKHEGSTAQPMQRVSKKRKRPLRPVFPPAPPAPPPPAPPAPAATAAATDDRIRAAVESLEQSVQEDSPEDTPMLHETLYSPPDTIQPVMEVPQDARQRHRHRQRASSTEQQDSLQEDWILGESRYRRTNGSRAGTSGSGRDDTDTDNENDINRDLEGPQLRAQEPQVPASRWMRDEGGTGLEPEPVKLVMRSNLTFNLGDDFFNWRSGQDVASLLDSLVLPPRAPPSPAYSLPASYSSDVAVARPDSTEDDSSSSSTSDSQGN